jgi:prephenate dehydrogenase
MLAQMDVCIVGLGLMGGSLGMALMRSGVPARLTGFDADKQTLRYAKERGAIHEAAADLAAACRNADLIVFATPIRSIPALVRETLPHLKEGAILTDLGSTKGFLYKALGSVLESLPTKGPVAYVGGHPMTGSERSGIQAAQPDLFAGKPYVVCPPLSWNDPGAALAERASRAVVSLVAAVGAKTVFMAPEEQDLICAIVSHLPYLAACSIVGCLEDLEGVQGGAGRLAAGGFRDTTRVASSEPVMGSDMLLTNHVLLKRAFLAFREKADEILRLVEAGDVEKLRARLSSARRFRDGILQRGSGDDRQGQ